MWTAWGQFATGSFQAEVDDTELDGNVTSGFPLMIQLTDIIFSGVYDRFPDVQIAFLEGGCTWVPFMMDRLDSEYDSIFGIAARRRLHKRPSEYLRSDRFWVSMDLGERGLKYALDAIGASNIFPDSYSS